MKRLTKAQSELIDAFLAEHAARVSTAQLEKDFLISEIFSAFTEPVVYQGYEAKFVLCGVTAVSKAHRFTERISEDVDLRVSLPPWKARNSCQ
jgi:5-keto 4-deoxyuronate isomerase